MNNIVYPVSSLEQTVIAVFLKEYESRVSNLVYINNHKLAYSWPLFIYTRQAE